MKKDTLFTYEWDFNKALHVAWHKKMWLWLAENPSEGTYRYFLKQNIECKEHRFGCFYAKKEDDSDRYYCNMCFIKWHGKYYYKSEYRQDCYDLTYNGDERGLYLRWRYAPNLTLRAQLARAIANLPVR